MWLAVGEVVLGHARLRQGEAGEHSDRVERDEAVDLGAGHDQHDDRRARQEEDPVREHEAVAALRELTRHEVVFGVEAREAREIGEARVGGQHEDQHRADLQGVEEHVAQRSAAVDGPTDLADHGRRAALVRHGVDVRGHGGQAEEHHAEKYAHDHQRDLGVLPRRLAKSGHTVRDRLHAGDGCATRRERVQHHVERRPHPDARRRTTTTEVQHARLVRRRGTQGAVHELPGPRRRASRNMFSDEEVGRHREDPARFAHAAQVAEGDEHHEADRDRQRVGGQRRDSRARARRCPRPPTPRR